MRRFAYSSLAVATLAAGVSGQECAVPQPYCAPQCAVPGPTAAPVAAPTPATGRYVRGPGPGAATGESYNYGIRGPVLHIPEIRVPLPTLELPGLFMVRHDAAKIFDAIRSPFVEDEAVETGLLSPVSAPTAAPVTPTAAPVQYVPYCPPACAAPTQCTMNDKTLEAILARLDAVEKENVRLRQSQVSANEGYTPVAAVQPNMPSKPATGLPPQSRTRPVSAPVQTEISTASYQVASRSQPAAENAPTSTRKPRGTLNGGLSTPPSAQSNSAGNWGDWTSKK